MDWLMDPQINSTFGSLGAYVGDVYRVSEDCLITLEEIMCKLAVEDPSLRTFRRAIGFGKNVENDLMPLLVNAKDTKIIDTTIRLLVNLTVPLECLLSVHLISRSEIGRHTIFELNQLLMMSKEAFVDWKSTKAVIDYMKGILERDSLLTTQQCDSVNSCLLLLRNILHVPEMGSRAGAHSTTCQNQIIWNLFTHSIDKLLIYLMSCPQRAYWSITMAQLVALMYKDQHISTLHKLLNLWFESTLSESSEDNESNTSPPKQCSGESSPMLTSDPTSDSSDNGSGKMPSTMSSCETPQTKKNKGGKANNAPVEVTFAKQPPLSRAASPTAAQSTAEGGGRSDNDMASNQQEATACKSQQPQEQQQSQEKLQGQVMQSENSDCGYGTQVEKESISTSSNEDDIPHQRPVHQKPPSNQKQRFNAANKQRNPISVQEKKELRRKKLVKRGKSNIINMKGLMYHVPSDEDVSHILKEFTVDFLLKGYGNLTKALHMQLLSDLQVHIDTSHFFWLITYFLKFATQLELDLEHIKSVLCFDIISYITFQGVVLCEQLEQFGGTTEMDIKPCLRRIHLEDNEKLKLLHLQISGIQDLKSLFVLLIRCYNPSIQSRQYLQDLIITNHKLLLMLDGARELTPEADPEDMLSHLKQFATVEIMHQYGLVLQDFSENCALLNDCVFTMMHHVSGDLGQVNVLFQPNILKTCSQIWETEFELCDDWSDLIEYVIHKFINKPKPAPLTLSSTLPDIGTQLLSGNQLGGTWRQDEKDCLHWYYVQCRQSKCLVADILKLFQQNGNQPKTRLSIIEQLREQDIVTLAQYDDLMKEENPEYERNMLTPALSVVSEDTSREEDGESKCTPKAIDDIQVLRDRLQKENRGKLIAWLQKSLLDCCFVRLNQLSGDIYNASGVAEGSSVNVMEPVAFHCILKKQSIPVVPWNQEQFAILSYQPFILLLHKLGFHMPTDAKKMFVRIPEFWTADILYNIALKLGPLDKSILKFDLLDKVLSMEKQPLVDPCPPAESRKVKLDLLDPSKDIDRANVTGALLAGKPVAPMKLLYDLSIIVESNDDNGKGDGQLAEDVDGLDCSEEQVMDKHDAVSACETASVASDLTHMYVSDVDDKHDSVPSIL
uniref:Timeless n=1 Tax=Anopheles atroparvus TaxID=41427 RepID=A0A182JH25_ANOAO